MILLKFCFASIRSAMLPPSVLSYTVVREIVSEEKNIKKIYMSGRIRVSLAMFSVLNKTIIKSLFPDFFSDMIIRLFYCIKKFKIGKRNVSTFFICLKLLIVKRL